MRGDVGGIKKEISPLLAWSSRKNEAASRTADARNRQRGASRIGMHIFRSATFLVSLLFNSKFEVWEMGEMFCQNRVDGILQATQIDKNAKVKF